MSNNKHENYEILNLIGYGLAKFDMDFVKQFYYQTKTDFYEEMVRRGVGETVGTIKNRQDLFDPFFPNDRKGWWQKGDTYIHRKLTQPIFADEVGISASQVKWAVSELNKRNRRIAALETENAELRAKVAKGD